MEDMTVINVDLLWVKPMHVLYMLIDVAENKFRISVLYHSARLVTYPVLIVAFVSYIHTSVQSVYLFFWIVSIPIWT